MAGFSKGLHAGLSVGKEINRKRELKQQQKSDRQAASQKQVQDAFTKLEQDFAKNLEGIAKARSTSAQEPQFPKEFTKGLMEPAAARLDQMAEQYGFGMPGYGAQYMAAMQSPLGSDIAQNEGQMQTMKAQAAVKAGGGFSTETMDNGQIQQTNNITGELSIKGSATKRRLVTIAGKSGLFSDEEILDAQNKGAVIGDPDKDLNTKTVFNNATGQFVFASDSDIANNGNLVPPQAAQLAGRLEIAATAVGIDPAIIRSGRINELSSEEAQALQTELKTNDPMTLFMTSLLTGGNSPSAGPAASSVSGTRPNGMTDKEYLEHLRSKKGRKAAK